MSAATDTVQVFTIGPEAVGNRNVGAVVRTDSQVVLAHVWQSGGETALHSHHSSDATWVVLQGHVTFWGEGETKLASLGPAGGIYIPRNVKYWFENDGTEPLIMVRCASREKGVGDDRVYVQ